MRTLSLRVRGPDVGRKCVRGPDVGRKYQKLPTAAQPATAVNIILLWLNRWRRSKLTYLKTLSDYRYQYQKPRRTLEEKTTLIKARVTTAGVSKSSLHWGRRFRRALRRRWVMCKWEALHATNRTPTQIGCTTRRTAIFPSGVCLFNTV
jgi:hypothetical protein